MYYAVYVKTILSCIEIPKGLYKFIMLCTSKQYFLALKYLRKGRIERGGGGGHRDEVNAVEQELNDELCKFCEEHSGATGEWYIDISKAKNPGRERWQFGPTQYETDDMM